MTAARLKLVAGAAIALILLGGIYFSRSTPTSAVKLESPSVASRSRPARPDPEEQEELEKQADAIRISKDWAALLKWLNSEPRPSDDEIRERLLELRLSWIQIDMQVRAEAIRLLLASGQDAATGLKFEVGQHGMLSGWPSLRVFLLDVLAVSDPEMAAEIARTVLDKTQSPAEFATGLRSLTQPGLGRAKDSELIARFGQLLSRQDWQESPAFAEAFDLPRYIGSTEAMKQLANWQGDPTLRAMALDEFAADHPESITETLAAAEGLDEGTRATLMARTNPDDPHQSNAVDDYLRSPDRSPEEVEAFLKIFPLRSATTGFRLYGETPAPYDFEQIKTTDLAARDLVNTWATDPSLEKYRPQILTLQRRLTKWIEEAK